MAIRQKKPNLLGIVSKTCEGFKPSFPFISTQTLLIPLQESAGCCLVSFLTIQSAKWQQGTDRLKHHLRATRERAEELKWVIVSQGFETLVNNANLMQQICILCITRRGCSPGRRAGRGEELQPKTDVVATVPCTTSIIFYNSTNICLPFYFPSETGWISGKKKILVYEQRCQGWRIPAVTMQIQILIIFSGENS